MSDAENLIEKNAKLQKELVKIKNPNRTYLNENFIPLLVIAMTIMAFSMIITMFFVEIPDTNKDTVYLSVGIVLNAFALAIGYIFGKSKSDSEYKEAKVKQP